MTNLFTNPRPNLYIWHFILLAIVFSLAIFTLFHRYPIEGPVCPRPVYPVVQSATRLGTLGTGQVFRPPRI